MKKITTVLTIVILLCSFLSGFLIIEDVEASSLHYSRSIESPIGEIIDDVYPYNFTEPIGHIYSIEFSRGNDYVAIATRDPSNVYIRHTGNWTNVTYLTDATDDVMDVAWSPNDYYFAFCSKDSKVYVYWVSNWTKVTELTEASSQVSSVDFSATNLMSYGGTDEGIWLHNVSDSFANVSYQYVGSNINSVKFTHEAVSLWDESARLMVGTSSGTVLGYLTFTGTIGGSDPVISLSDSPIWSVDVNSDDTLIACGSSGNLYILSYVTYYGEFRETQNISISLTSVIRDVEFSSGNYNWLAITTYTDSNVLIYNTTSWEQVGYFENDYWTRCVDFDQNNNFLVYGGMEYIGGGYPGDVRIHSVFDIERISGYGTERIELSTTTNFTHSGNVTLKIPVTTNSYSVLNLTNNTDGSDGTERSTYESLSNKGDFFLNMTTDYIYIRPGNLTIGHHLYWTINLSYGLNFNLVIPQYLEVGDYYQSNGRISYLNETSCTGFYAVTRVLNDSNIDMLSINPEWDCHNGNYFCVFSTNSLVPDSYDISIIFTDSITGINIRQNETLYLSVDPGSGVHVSTFLHFTFYNNNTGIGIPSESFKIYASTDTTIDSTDRIYVDLYGVYTGQTIYYRVDDYYDNQIYPTTGDYETLGITSLEQFEDVPIDWHSFSVKNMNHSIVHFKMTNGSRTYPQYLYPYEPFYWWCSRYLWIYQ